MGIISDMITDVATNLIEDAADNLVIGASAAVVGAAKGIKAVGKAAVSAKNTVGNTVKEARETIGTAVDGAKEVTEKVLTATVGDKDTRHYKKEKRLIFDVSHYMFV